MKTIKLFLLFVVVTLSTTASFAQVSYLENPNWGANPDEREANVILYNFYKNAYNTQEYAAATGHLQELLVKSPKGSENIYLIAIRLYDSKVVSATSLDEKKIALDSLMFIYDKRAELFGATSKLGLPTIKEHKAKAYYRHNPSDLEGIQTLFHDAIEAGGEKPDLKLVNSYFKMLTDGYAIDIIEVDQLMDNYTELITLFDNSNDVNTAQEKEIFESLFINSGAVNCDNLEMLFKDKVTQYPDSLELVEKVFKLLSGSDCESDFYLDVAEKIYALKPTSQVSIILASAFQEKKDFVKALQYLNEAAANETDPTAKSNLYVNISGTELTLKNLTGAVKYANMAIELSPKNAYAYIILGTAYLQGSVSCSDFKQQTVYWLAYDAFETARRNLSEEDPQMANVKAQIYSCSENFPTTEECFFLGLNEGSPYKVECNWIKKETTVKFRK